MCRVCKGMQHTPNRQCLPPVCHHNTTHPANSLICSASLVVRASLHRGASRATAAASARRTDPDRSATAAETSACIS